MGWGGCYGWVGFVRRGEGRLVMGVGWRGCGFDGGKGLSAGKLAGCMA